MQSLLIAIQFLTRIPVKAEREWEDELIAQSVLYYPLVGLMIGLILWFSALLFEAVAPMLGAVMVLIIWVIITGGLHLDGLADSADAWAGGYANKQRSLEIMKDPSAGPFSVVVLVLLLLVKYVALVSLLESHQFWLLCVAPVSGRLSVVVLFLTTPYVRENGLGSVMARLLSRKLAYGVVLLTLILALVTLPFVVFILVLLTCSAVLYLLRFLMLHRLQGMTGDTIGASLEITEAVTVFVLATIVSLNIWL